MKETINDVTDYVLADADGNPVRAYDDVVLLDDTVITDNRRQAGEPDTFPAGTRGTLIFLVDQENRLVNIECDPTGLFAQAPASRTRLVQRREDKLWKDER